MTSEQKEVVSAAKAVIEAHNEADLGISQDHHLRKVVSTAEEPDEGWASLIRNYLLRQYTEDDTVDSKLKILDERFAF